LNTDTLASLSSRTSFRPFTIPVSSGTVYDFEKPEQFGATGDLQGVIHFSQHRFSIIDAGSITEVIESTPGKA
jgi:hypothetical protein